MLVIKYTAPTIYNLKKHKKTVPAESGRLEQYFCKYYLAILNLPVVVSASTITW